MHARFGHFGSTIIRVACQQNDNRYSKRTLQSVVKVALRCDISAQFIGYIKVERLKKKIKFRKYRIEESLNETGPVWKPQALFHYLKKCTWTVVYEITDEVMVMIRVDL